MVFEYLFSQYLFLMRDPFKRNDKNRDVSVVLYLKRKPVEVFKIEDSKTIS